MNRSSLGGKIRTKRQSDHESTRSSLFLLDLSNCPSWEETCEELNKTVLQKRSFWKGSNIILKLSDFSMSPKEAASLSEMARQAAVEISEVQTTSSASLKTLMEEGFQVSSHVAERSLKPPFPSEPMKSQLAGGAGSTFKEAPQNSAESQTLFVGAKEGISLRGGQSVSYHGDLVLLGDVNPGCQIEAGGSIIVYGKLSGTVKAGVGVKEDSLILPTIFVKALKMTENLQISIGPHTACSSSKSDSKAKIYPETVQVVDGQLCRFADFKLRGA